MEHLAWEILTYLFIILKMNWKEFMSICIWKWGMVFERPLFLLDSFGFLILYLFMNCAEEEGIIKVFRLCRYLINHSEQSGYPKNAHLWWRWGSGHYSTRYFLFRIILHLFSWQNKTDGSSITGSGPSEIQKLCIIEEAFWKKLLHIIQGNGFLLP